MAWKRKWEFQAANKTENWIEKKKEALHSSKIFMFLWINMPSVRAFNYTFRPFLPSYLVVMSRKFENIMNIRYTILISLRDIFLWVVYIFSMYVTVYVIFNSSLHICNVRNGWLCIIAVDIVLELANYNWDLLQCVNENWNWVWTWLNIISSTRAYLNNRAFQSCRYSFFLLWKIIPFNRT